MLGSRRTAGLVVLALAVCPAAAQAGSITYAPPYVYGTYYTTYTAAPGEPNDMRIDGSMGAGYSAIYPASGTVRFTDLVGITPDAADAGCTGAEVTYLCQFDGSHGRYTHIVRARLGDGDDKLALRQTEAEGGRILNGERDCPYFSNACVPLEIDAGAGDDYVDVADGVNGDAALACGPGYDVIRADPGDSVAADCEDVTRGRATAVPQRGGRLTVTIAESGTYREASRYLYADDSGAANDMRLDLDATRDDADGPTVAITDLTGITQTAGCTGFPLRYSCALWPELGPGDNPDRLVLTLGAGDDRIRVRDGDGEPYRLASTPTDCTVLSTGYFPYPPLPTCQWVVIDGGAGNDYVDIRDGYLRPGQIAACGGGFDTVKIDAGETVPADCEDVSAT